MDEMNYTEFNAEPNTEKAPRYSEAIVGRAPLMAKWLMTMFWVNIAHIIINFIKIESSVVYTTTQAILINVCTLILCLALFQMRGEDERYGRAALFTLIPVVLDTVFGILIGYGDSTGMVIFVALISVILTLLATYNEFHAHSCIVGGLDSELGDRWQKLWVWQVIGITGTVLSLFVAALGAAGLGAVLVLIVAIYVLVIQIIYLVTLYRSAKAYRGVAEEEGTVA